MQTKPCGKCGNVKPLTEFAKHSARKRQGYCKACNNAYGREYYKRNKQYFIDKHRERRHKLKQRLAAVRAASGCADCGERDPIVLDFDHRPGEEKLAEVTVLAHEGRGWAAIAREIAKCDIVCANCHRRRTAARQDQCPGV